MRDKIILPILIILFGVLLRLVPHLPNVVPITAIALFGGMYLNKKYALFLPLIIMLISDFFLGFHDTIFFVYLGFFISGLLGLWVSKRKTAEKILIVTLVASTQFFIITNLGVWLVGHMYPKTLQGLTQCFVMAIPFFRNTIMGDLLYTTTFILLFEFFHYFAQRKILALSRKK